MDAFNRNELDEISPAISCENRIKLEVFLGSLEEALAARVLRKKGMIQMSFQYD